VRPVSSEAVTVCGRDNVRSKKIVFKKIQDLMGYFLHKRHRCRSAVSDEKAIVLLYAYIHVNVFT
jgi:hypothetical protein